MNRQHDNEKTTGGAAPYRAARAGNLWLTLFAALLVCVALAQPGVRAQTCVSTLQGVPAAAPPPDWWDPPPPVYAQELSDPRWNGASAINYGNGLANQAVFRFGHDAAYAYLSWQMKVTPAGMPDENQLYFGYVNPAGKEIITKVQLLTLGQSKAVAATGATFSIDSFERNADGSQGTAYTPPLPDWRDQTRVWINDPTNNSYAVQVRVPLGEFQFDGSNRFRLWYEIFGGLPNMISYKFLWPRTGGIEFIDDAAFPYTRRYPAMAGWEFFKLDTAGCVGAGVSLGYYDIGTTNSPSSKISYDSNPGNPQPANTFFARPTNLTGSAIGAGVIHAKFRIANWGSMPNWEDGVNINTLWAVLQNCEDVPTMGAIANGTTATAAAQAQCVWHASAADVTALNNGTRRTHECMLVELSDTSGLTYVNNSVYRNMDFVAASRFERSDIEVSIKGLAPISPQGRDVYLYVEALNMPAKVDPTPPPTPGVTAAPRDGRMPTPDELQRLVESGQLTQEDLDRTYPTYRVHVFYDTGQKLRTGGTARPVLRPQGSFGYYVTHQGQLYGWNHSIQGQNVTLEQLAPNFYRVRNVPNGGKFLVKTTIEALEQPGGGPTPTPTPPGPAPETKFAVFFHGGANFLHGNFGNLFKSGFSFNAGVEYAATDYFSLEGIFGFHRFNGKTFGTVTVGDENLFQFSGNGKFYLAPPGTVRPWVNFGIGAYKFDPGSTRFGGSVGGGIQFNVTKRAALEAAYNFHAVTSFFGSDTKFSTLQGGVRFRF